MKDDVTAIAKHRTIIVIPGFLYYSGHGIASESENHLIPTDVDEPSTVMLRVRGVKQSEVLAMLRNEAPNAAHYLVLDACRNTLQGSRGGKGFEPVGRQRRFHPAGSVSGRRSNASYRQ